MLSDEEIDELVLETRRGLNKYSSFDYKSYYVEVLKLKELHEINKRLQEPPKAHMDHVDCDKALDFLKTRKDMLLDQEDFDD